MDEELEIGKSYTVSELLNFLEENYRKNIFIESKENINLFSILHKGKNKYTVYKVQSSFLHRFARNQETGHIGYQINTDYKIYFIKPE